MDREETSIAGFSAQKLAEIPSALQNVVDQGDLSGFVTLIWRNSEIVQRTALGKRNIEENLPMERDTLFRIASMTKPITSVAALMLLEEGRFKLDDPITKWAPEFADMRVLKKPSGPLDETTFAPRAITFDDLFTHRSGFSYGFSATGPIAQAYDKTLGNPLVNKSTPDAWLKALSELPLLYAPGERLHYGVSTDVLGFLIGRIAGTTFREFLMERLFKPLGMVDTDFWIPPAKMNRMSVVYRFDDKTNKQVPVPFHLFDSPPAFCGGGGGLISTADDYLQFAKMMIGKGELNGKRYLKSETIEMMTTNRLTPEQRAIPFLGSIPMWEPMGFGLGVSVVTDPEKLGFLGRGGKGAFGWPGAFGTWWQADPANGMIVIYLIQNSMPLGAGAVAQMADMRQARARLALPMFQSLTYGALS
jgi:CubicO group peptidase (beta-lactamase class C family)